MDLIQAWTNANRAHKAAETRHANEQAKGQRDMSPRQTRRMYLAAENLRRAYWKLSDASQALDHQREMDWYRDTENE